MKVYVGTYEKYNQGSIGGAWIDLENYKSIKEFYSACEKLHDEEYSPEFMFQDYENIPSQLIGESFIDSRVFDVLNLELDEEERDAFFEFMENQNFYWEDISEAFETFEECFMGKYDELQDFTDELADNDIACYMDNDNPLIYYFDYDKYYHTMKHDYFITSNGHVFANR
jgi:antirestriction protein